MAKLTIDSDMTGVQRPTLDGLYLYAVGDGHTDKRYVTWFAIATEYGKFFDCRVYPYRGACFDDDIEHVTSVWDLVRA